MVRPGMCAMPPYGQNKGLPLPRLPGSGDQPIVIGALVRMNLTSIFCPSDKPKIVEFLEIPNGVVSLWLLGSCQVKAVWKLPAKRLSTVERKWLL